MKINYEINRLLNFAWQNGMIEESDIVYSANLLLDVLQSEAFEPETITEVLPEASQILANMLDYAVEKNIIDDTAAQRDLYDTRIMNCVMMRPSEVIAKFDALYTESPQKATEFFYKLSTVSNYIRKSRVDKNIIWQTATEYGDLDITINLSKPEKDPRDIIKARNVKSVSYPKCLLCRENEGFAGTISHPARQTHRLIPLTFNKHQWYMQYSPYTYYNEHCIVLNADHIPMKIARTTFINLLSFVEKLPHYFIGSNADLPIVGGSILSHDHYQGGHYDFAMAKAPIEKEYSLKAYPSVKIGRVKWPMSALRLSGSDKEKLIDLAEYILNKWRDYSDESVDIFAYSGDVRHNTITPIARKRDSNYELDLVLRNNRTTEQYPLGIFHPHAEVHHIKKENIGLIEVMGLAVLPARLKTELAQIEQALLTNVSDISTNETIAKHAHWYEKLHKKYKGHIDKNNITAILNDEVGNIFMQVLTHAGVFKRNETGMAAFDKFISTL